MQIKLTKGSLLNEKGELVEAGYSTSLIRTYSRQDIKANKLRIKEWDYYIVSDGKRAIALTIDDNSYMSLGSVSVLNFEKPSYTTKSVIHLLSLGKVGLPSSLEQGNVFYKDKKVELSFEKNGQQRVLKASWLNFEKEKPFSFIQYCFAT